MTRLRWRRHRDEATCAEVAAVLQQFLDGQVDDVTTQRVRRHLEACHRCGLEVETYTAIKAALARQKPTIDGGSLERLRAFGKRLSEQDPPAESDSSA